MMLMVLACLITYGQNVSILADYETYFPPTDPSSGRVQGFTGGGPIAVADNPFLDLDNTSSTVLQYNKPAGNYQIIGFFWQDYIPMNIVQKIEYQVYGTGLESVFSGVIGNKDASNQDSTFSATPFPWTSQQGGAAFTANEWNTVTLTTGVNGFTIGRSKQVNIFLNANASGGTVNTGANTFYVDNIKVYLSEAVPTTLADIEEDNIELGIGASQRIYPRNYPIYATDKAFLFSSDDPSVATVDEGGLVTVVGAGFTTINFSSGSFKDSFTVNMSAVTTTFTTNWSNGEPTENSIAQIDGTYNGDSFVCDKLVVSATGSLEISSDVNIIVADDIYNAGAITIMSGGSLFNAGDYSGAGDFTVIRNSSWADGVNRYSMISSPVTSQTIGDLSSGFHYQYNTSDDTWTTFSGVMSAGKGYSAAGKGSLEFSGVPNSGDINVAASDEGQGFNLIGNPYTSAILYNDFVSENDGKINGAIWIWDDGGSETGSANSGDYITINSLGTASSGGGGLSGKTLDYDGTDLYLGVAQAFIVKAETGASSIDFTTSMRDVGHTSDDNFFRKEEKTILNLTATSASGVSTTVIGLTSDASAGYDSKYDAPALLGNAKTAIFSKMNGERYAIQGLALDATEVEIEVLTTEKTTIALADYINGKQSVALVDMESGKVTDLKTETYTFEPTVSGKKSLKMVIGGEAASVLASRLLTLKSNFNFPKKEFKS